MVGRPRFRVGRTVCGSLCQTALCLEMHDVDEKTLEEAKSVLSETEFERALHVWRKKFDGKPADVSEKARQIRFLMQRGFSGDVVRRVLDWEDPD